MTDGQKPKKYPPSPIPIRPGANRRWKSSAPRANMWWWFAAAKIGKLIHTFPCGECLKRESRQYS